MTLPRSGRMLVLSTVVGGVLAAGCSTGENSDTGQDTSRTTNVTSDTEGSSTGGSATDPNNVITTADPSETTSTSTSGTSCSFVCDSSGTGGVASTCDVFAQDCPEGEKCAAIISDGGGAWDAATCVPVNGAGVAGDVCTAASVHAGLDDCAKGFMCWDVDDTGMGTCVQLCMGTADAPICPDMGLCTIASDGALNLCLPECSPLLQDCAEGNACYPLNDHFSCIPDASGDSGVANDPCIDINVCEGGLTCGDAAFVGMGCPQGSVGCCTPFCDLTDPVACPNPDQSCIPFYDPMNLPVNPMDAADIGLCGVPG